MMRRISDVAAWRACASPSSFASRTAPALPPAAADRRRAGLLAAFVAARSDEVLRPEARFFPPGFFFFSEPLFAEPRPMGASPKLFRTEQYRVCRAACRGRKAESIRRGLRPAAAALISAAAKS